MEGSVDRRHLLVKAAGGFLGGAIGWIPNELVMHGHRLGQPMSTGLIVGSFISEAILAGLIGCLVLAADPSGFNLGTYARRRLVRCFVVCALLSLFSTYYSDRAFNAVLQAGGVSFNTQGEMVSGSIAMLVLARVIGWGIEGALVGAGVGIASLVVPNIIKGFFGGLIGGLIGGLCFDAIAFTSGGGLLARFFGFSVVGLSIGLLIGLVHELTKAAWLKVEAGRLRGRQFLIEKSRVSIGRAEENDVGLFGDPAVNPRHAEIVREGGKFVLKDVSGRADILVNGRQIGTGATLNDGDLIKIGNYELSFHLKKGQAEAPKPVSVAADGAATAKTQRQASVARLIDENGREYVLNPDRPTHLGRDLSNDVVLMMASVSRRHAVVEPRNGVFYIKDLDSHNGTYVAGQRVTEAPLKDGDQISLGDVRLIFRT